MRWVIAVALAGVGTARADAPALDDFYERTRERHADFTDCAIGYCDGTYLATLRVGAATANPSTGASSTPVAVGGRLGVDAGARRGVDLVRTRLYADVLRVNDTGQWIANGAWQTTAWKAFGRRRDDEGLHLSLDNVVARKTELDIFDVAQLQQTPYHMVDTEAEVAPLGPFVDKDGRLALPLGISNRLRFGDGTDRIDRRTSFSGALAIRGFAKNLPNHAQLDILRVKYTDWGDAGATTLSAGYQRLPYGLDTLPLWALVGYQWAGDRAGVVAQIGMDLPLAKLRIAPAFERRFDLDRTAMTPAFVRVTSSRLTLEHRVGPLRYGGSYESAVVEDRRLLRTVTPSLALAVRGLELGVAYRIVVDSREPMDAAPTSLLRDRFSVTVDQRW